MKDRVIALIPAFNEELRIGDTVSSLSATESINSIVVIDDGSNDATAKCAKEAGAEVIELPRNKGKGEAINQALGLINSYDILLLLDADLGNSASEAIRLIEPILQGEYDMTIAGFPAPTKKGGFGLVKALAAWGIEKCAGLSVVEPLSGQRAMSASVISSVKKLDGGFSAEVGLTIDAARKGFRILEVPTTMSHAATGRNISGFKHRGKQFYYVLKAILRRLW